MDQGATLRHFAKTVMSLSSAWETLPEDKPPLCFAVRRPESPPRHYEASGTCTLREATIFSSVLQKVSIPMFHAAAAMLKIAELEYNGANSVFLRALIDKKFALPYKAIDAIVSHFLRMKNDERDMPVLWHQCLLAVCQRYKNDLSQEQKSAIVDLTRYHSHYLISPEIRRELESKEEESSHMVSKIEIVSRPNDSMEF
ncbi:hypothetical protein RB195_010065 [Necator americanus]|uniref:Bystin n=1 Tax=Necator americanus TaxID=51031 RepID=A0ABR1CW80_NECAM